VCYKETRGNLLGFEVLTLEDATWEPIQIYQAVQAREVEASTILLYPNVVKVGA
jgi:hypothetical protein